MAGRLAGGAVGPPSVVDVGEGGNCRWFERMSDDCAVWSPPVAGPVVAGAAGEASDGVSDDVTDDDAVVPAAAAVVVGCVDLGVFPSHPLPDART